MLKTFERPTLTPEEIQQARRLAKIIVFTQADRNIKLRMVQEVITENMRCFKEINQHRAALGFEPLPLGQPQGLPDA